MMLAAIYHGILAFFFAVVAVLLMVVILLQRGKGVGLSGAFGGTGGGHAAFGAKTGDILTWITIVGAGLFMLFAVLLNYVFVPGEPDLGPQESPSDESGSLWRLDEPAAGPEYARAAIFGESEA